VQRQIAILYTVRKEAISIRVKKQRSKKSKEEKRERDRERKKERNREKEGNTEKMRNRKIEYICVCECV